MNKTAACSAVLVFLCATGSAPSYAGNGIIGSDLQLKCAGLKVALSNPNAPVDANTLGSENWCIGYIQGDIEGTRITSVLDKAGRYPYCPPPSSTALQDAQVVMKYMDDHPEDLNQPAGAVIFLALRGVWPCSSPK